MRKKGNVVLGVTGSIAIYKAADLLSKLVQEGIEVDVVMTEAAAKLVSPILLQSLSHRPVSVDMFSPPQRFEIEHVSLAERADLIAVVPATANTIAKLAAGIADNLLCATILAARCPVLLAPAMDAGMFENPATQENLEKLKERGFIIVGPERGRLASGLEGWGRLADPRKILAEILKILGKKYGDLAGRRILVTGGGTREPLDPVRFVGNRSSGKMGIALAEAARDRGADVTLILGPTLLEAPCGVEVVRVETAEMMREEVLRRAEEFDALIMAAAVADFRPASPSPSKIRRDAPSLRVELERTPDILAEAKAPIKVGFAAETREGLLENARRKLFEKGLDLIVANDISSPESGFEADTNKVVIVDREGEEILPLLPKREVAERVLDKVSSLIRGREGRRERRAG